jgi:PAS domain S-box-containing protein
MSVALTTTGFLALRHAEESEWDQHFQRRVETIGTLFNLRCKRAAADLTAIQVLFANSASVTAAEFEHAARTLLTSDPDLAALEWVPVVPASDRDRFEQELRTQGFPAFRIGAPAHGSDTRPAAATDEYWPVSYITPEEPNRAAQGFDLRFGPTVAELTRARATRALAVSAPLRLVQTSGNYSSIIFILPVFRRQDEAFTGWVQSIMHAPALLGATTAEATRLGLLVSFDSSDPASGQVQQLQASSAPADHRPCHHLTQELGGRRWHLSVWPDDTFAAERHTIRPWIALGIGGFTTVLLTLFIRNLTRRSRDIERLVDRRTRELTTANRALAAEIEQRRRAESELRAAKERHEGLVHSVQGVVWEFDRRRGQPGFVSRQAEALFGYPLAQWTDEPNFWSRIIHADDRGRVVAAVRAPPAGTDSFTERYRIATADNRLLWVQTFFSVSATSAESAPLYALTVDITAQRRAEEARTRDLLILASVRDAIIVADNAGCITFWNAGAENLFGWTEAEMVGQPFFQRFASEHAAEVQQVLATVAAGHDWCGEWSESRKDGTRIWIDVNLRRFLDARGQPAGLIGLAYDVTKRRLEQEARFEVERRLREAQKLESLGVLAGGIAHDFNNLLTTVLGQASLLRLDLPAASPMQENLGAIETAALRAADLCQQMLAYSGCARCALRHLDLGALIEETARLARPSLGAEARLVLDVAPGLPPVYADPVQLRQMVMNLVLNAGDALGEQAGSITVTTSLIHADRATLDATLLGADLPEGDYCLLAIRDTGCGMPPETLSRIFEPFFSTKFTGRGLGLSAVLGIVRSHHGTLRVTSAPGQGSDFRVLLPAARQAVPEPEPEPESATAGSPTGRRVLIVDDEASVRETAGLMLKASGHEVEYAADGQAALEAVRGNPHAFGVVLLDYAMPRMNGSQTLAALRRIAPTLPVVLMSGFSEQEAFERFGPHGPATFLQKPFSATALRELVRHHLAPKPRG